MNIHDPKAMQAELTRLGMKACDRVLGATGQREALEKAMREAMAEAALAISLELDADDLSDIDDERERDQWRAARAT